jgi:hypothetical protein
MQSIHSMRGAANAPRRPRAAAPLRARVALLALGALSAGLAGCEQRAEPTPMSAASAPAASARSVAAAALPQEVLAFRAQRDQCDHFRGEEGYDAQRAAFLAAELARTCTGTDATLAALRERYRQDPSALAALKDYEDTIE